MKRFWKFSLFILTIAVLFGRCGGYEHETIPNVRVNFTIYPDDVTYYNLNFIGGYEYFTGGVAGIIVYRIDMSTFIAFDRACSYDWEEPEAWLWVEESGLTIYDQHCGSRFNILDGSVINGPAKFPLKYYKTNYDGRRLRIHS